YSVSWPMPSLQPSSITARTLWTPRACPSTRGRPRSWAQRPLPSMMTATCRGSRAGSSPAAANRCSVSFRVAGGTNTPSRPALHPLPRLWRGEGWGEGMRRPRIGFHTNPKRQRGQPSLTLRVGMLVYETASWPSHPPSPRQSRGRGGKNSSRENGLFAVGADRHDRHRQPHQLAEAIDVAAGGGREIGAFPRPRNVGIPAWHRFKYRSATLEQMGIGRKLRLAPALDLVGSANTNLTDRAEDVQ